MAIYLDFETKAEELIEELGEELEEIREKDLEKVAELPKDERDAILDRLQATIASLDFLGWTLREPKKKE